MLSVLRVSELEVYISLDENNTKFLMVDHNCLYENG